ncbi:MAG: hypothetical protein EOP51_14425, partial [Sphingobacteriales bacterium]
MLKNTFFRFIMPAVILLALTNINARAQVIYTGTNSATAKGTALGSQVQDNSNNGTVITRLSDDGSPLNFPMIGIAKSASVPVFQSNGSYNIDYTITIRNYGNLALSNVQVSDLLSATFPSPTTFTIRAVTTKGGANAANITLNAAYDGTAINPNLLTSATSALPISGVATIVIPVNVVPNGAYGPFNNTANAAATTADLTPVTDVSTNGTDPDAGGGVPANDGDLNPFNNSVPTPVSFPMLGIAKSASVPVFQSNGSYNIDYTVTLKNFGTVALSSVQATDILTTVFPSPSTWTLR